MAPCCCVSVSWFPGFHVHSGCCHFSFARMSRVRPGLWLAFRPSFRHALRPMRPYLRIFNPLIALLVFVLCSFAAMKEDKDKPIVIGNVVAGGIPTYFFAKGMFCGVALILLGKILENQLGRDDR